MNQNKDYFCGIYGRQNGTGTEVSSSTLGIPCSLLTRILYSHDSFAYNRYCLIFEVEDVIKWNIRSSLSSDINKNIVAPKVLSLKLQEKSFV